MSQERGFEQEVVPPAEAASPPPAWDTVADAREDRAADAEPGTEPEGAGRVAGGVDGDAAPGDGVPGESPEGDAAHVDSRQGDDAGPEADAPQDAGEPAAQDAADDEAGAAELHERAGKADAYLELAQRTQADFDNYRKRMTREVRAAEARGIGKLARELLPALDNLERALAAVERAEPKHHLSEGIRLVTAELSAALGRSGIRGYDPTGERFDPVQHEAVAQQPVEGAESGTVVEVLQAGYRLNEAILRPARVIVAS